IIMAQLQHAANVHPDELCPPNKRYDLMDANKKVDLEHVQCPSKSKILMNIIKNQSVTIHQCSYNNNLLEMLITILQDDDIMKNTSIPEKQNKVGMRIPSWMITNEMKLTEHYKMQSARLTPPVLVPSAEKADEIILQDMIQVSLADTRILKNKKSKRKMLAQLKPRSDKESPEVEIVQEKEEETTPMVDVSNIVPPINVDDEEDEITDEMFELRKRVKGNNIEETDPQPEGENSAKAEDNEVMQEQDEEFDFWTDSLGF
ncbi:hypothetical protein Tco_0615944, partial [Tanacetum coccineum]